MPRVKIDYVVSFSSEDPEHPANNLLAREVSKKKWLCKMGEPSCSVVLQLAKAVKISGVHIGAYHAALVEVLVGRSEKPDDPFEVLVPSSVLLSPSESRRAMGVERVRSFGAAALAPAAAQRWDRMRLVCSQPYNKHCKYGISFIHIDEPGEETSLPPGAARAPLAVPPRLLVVEADSSEEDDFRPGELFASHRHHAADTTHSLSTESQIRQATSQALKNISDSSSRLTKTPISKQPPRTPHQPSPTPARTHGDNQPQKQDQEHTASAGKGNTDKKEKQSENVKAQDNNRKQHYSSVSDSSAKCADKTDESNHTTRPAKDQRPAASDPRPHTKRDKRGHATPATSRDTKRDTSRDTCDDTSRDKRGKRPRPSTDQGQTDEERPGPRCSWPLRGVVFALSGYENPRRARLRDLALRLGATYCRDWTPDCTHLVCAFPNTPKLKQLRASSGPERAAPAVLAEWLEQCAARGRLLPWRWYATEPQRRVQPPRSLSGSEPSESERDTDDEIEETLRKQKKRRQQSPEVKARASPSSPAPAPAPPAPADDSLDEVQFVRDERMRGNVTVHDSDSEHTDHDEHAADEQQIDETKSLPNFFDGYTFSIDDSVTEANCDKELLARYVRAYGGVIVDEEADYVLCVGAHARCGGAAVSPRWLWACHAQRRRLPHSTTNTGHTHS